MLLQLEVWKARLGWSGRSGLVPAGTGLRMGELPVHCVPAESLGKAWPACVVLWGVRAGEVALPRACGGACDPGVSKQAQERKCPRSPVPG